MARKQATQKEKEYIQRWTKENTTTVNIRLNKEADADIISWFETHQPKQTAVKELIREQIKQGK